MARRQLPRWARIGWLAAVGVICALALSPVDQASAAGERLPGGTAAEPCHKDHCHGDKICGGGWKDYRRAVEASSEADSSEAACEAALASLTAQAKADAAERCPELHPCGACPGGCTGCKSERPAGRIDADKTHRSSSKRDGGGYSCQVETEAVYRCRCGACKKDS